MNLNAGNVGLCCYCLLKAEKIQSDADFMKANISMVNNNKNFDH